MLDRHPDIGWFWAVHCETSTGVLNDMAALKALCVKRRVRLCLDCVSSLGTVPRGFTILARDSSAAPAVITIVFSPTISSELVGKTLEEEGLFLSYQSDYLLKRNWIQICLMGNCSRKSAAVLLRRLTRQVRGIPCFV